MEELKSQTVPFLKLPPEIRNQIYRYLLCIKYTKHQSQSQGVIVPLLWPTYKYRFYTSIFGTNHQIQHESKHLARHENRFILIRSKSTFWMDVVCRNAGISCVCRGARELSHLVMDVELGWANLSLDPSGHTFEYLICCEQLSPFCEGLLLFNQGYSMTGLAKMTFNISLLHHPQDRTLTSTPLPMSTQQLLLEPFKMLSYAVESQIDGPVSPDYKAIIVEKMCRQYRTLEDSIQKITSLTEEGKEAFLESRFASAISKQRSALKEIVLTFGRLASHEIVPSGDFAGQTYHEMQNHLLWKLRSDTVAAYLKLHQWKDAYEWACYATDEHDYAGDNPRDHAMLLFRKAFASKELGEHDRARREYQECKKFAGLHFTGPWEDREMESLRLALESRKDGCLGKKSDMEKRLPNRKQDNW